MPSCRPTVAKMSSAAVIGLLSSAENVRVHVRLWRRLHRVKWSIVADRRLSGQWSGVTGERARAWVRVEDATESFPIPCRLPVRKTTNPWNCTNAEEWVYLGATPLRVSH